MLLKIPNLSFLRRLERWNFLIVIPRWQVVKIILLFGLNTIFPLFVSVITVAQDFFRRIRIFFQCRNLFLIILADYKGMFGWKYWYVLKWLLKCKFHIWLITKFEISIGNSQIVEINGVPLIVKSMEIILYLFLVSDFKVLNIFRQPKVH